MTIRHGQIILWGIVMILGMVLDIKELVHTSTICMVIWMASTDYDIIKYIGDSSYDKD